MVLMPDGIAMDVKPKQRIKVQSGMSFRRCERRTVFKLVHFSKTCFPITVTLSGSFISDRAVQL